jgi:hypothetical protein
MDRSYGLLGTDQRWPPSVRRRPAVAHMSKSSEATIGERIPPPGQLALAGRTVEDARSVDDTQLIAFNVRHRRLLAQHI